MRFIAFAATIPVYNYSKSEDAKFFTRVFVVEHSILHDCPCFAVKIGFLIHGSQASMLLYKLSYSYKFCDD